MEKQAIPRIKFQLWECACSDKENCRRMFLNFWTNKVRLVGKEIDDVGSEEKQQTVSFLVSFGTYLCLKSYQNISWMVSVVLRTLLAKDGNIPLDWQCSGFPVCNDLLRRDVCKLTVFKKKKGELSLVYIFWDSQVICQKRIEFCWLLEDAASPILAYAAVMGSCVLCEDRRINKIAL